MGEHDNCIELRTLPLGLLQVPDGQFGSSLAEVLEAWLGRYQHLPIYMAGMVGSLKGWINVDYVSTPASAALLSRGKHSFQLPWGVTGTIYPGISHQTDKQYDVMRGEEVQLLGLSLLTQKNELSAILPGTHSKHACIDRQQIVDFKSYLTGEVFSLLINHSLLGKGITLDDEFEETSFLAGVDDAQQGEFTHQIFLGWTHRLFGKLSDSQVGDYLSGMLIGFELKQTSQPFYYLVGNQKMCERYQFALNHLEKQSEIVCGDRCFLAGMIALKREEKHVYAI
nr:hypothetical protein BCU55_12415 [Shewanella sp. 10N.286.48.A6]